MKIDWVGKLTSRKFWAAIADFMGMLLIALHVADTTATQNAKYMRFYTGVGYGRTYKNDISINYPPTETSYHPHV